MERRDRAWESGSVSPAVPHQHLAWPKALSKGGIYFSNRNRFPGNSLDHRIGEGKASSI